MLHLLALEPVVEMMADKNSYGFRPKRSAADAIEQCFVCLAQRVSAHFVLEGDIEACFDSISQPWMLENIVMDKVMLKKWFDAGYVDKGTLYQMERGTVQGSLCKALHNEPYAKKVIMQSSLPNSLISNNFIAFYFA